MSQKLRSSKIASIASLAVAAGSLAFVVGCNSGWQTDPNASAAATASASASMDAQARATIDRFKAQDPSIEPFLRNAYGYAVFPSIGRGGFIVGGGGGDGVVFQGSQRVGTATVAFGTIGAQVGGQTFSEIIAFQNEAAFNRFKANQMELAAGASAVAVNSGAAASANWANGVAVFTMADAGLMLDASIGGQKFTFRPG